jgi:hypothetical protein
MKLFFITHDNDDGENMDWFVAANDRDQAVEVWRRENGVEPDIADGPTHVFEVACASLKRPPPQPKLLGWHTTEEIPSV